MVKTLVFLQPYFCVQYEVLEAAQLAIETMNGILVEGSYIKVRWPKLKIAPFIEARFTTVHMDIPKMPRHEAL